VTILPFAYRAALCERGPFRLIGACLVAGPPLLNDAGLFDGGFQLLSRASEFLRTVLELMRLNPGRSECGRLLYDTNALKRYQRRARQSLGQFRTFLFTSPIDRLLIMSLILRSR